MNISGFLQAFYGRADRGFFLLWQEGVSHWYDLSLPDQLQYIATDAKEKAEYSTVYYNICLQKQAYDGRGTKETAIFMPGLWAEIDVESGEAHKGNKVRVETKERALKLITEEFPYVPSIVVDSGHGYHAYWLFDEPLWLTTEQENSQGQDLMRRWMKGIVAPFFKELGYDVDATWDLARMYRLPETRNHKIRPPKPVEVVFEGHQVYSSKSMIEVTDQLADKVDIKAKNRVIIEREKSEVGGFTVNPTAELPEKVKILLQHSGYFKQVWDGNTTLPDPSPSGREMGIANFLAASTMEFTTQEIVDCLCYHRRTVTGDPPKHDQYYLITIQKAFSSVHRTEVKAISEEEKTVEEAVVILQEAAQPKKKKKNAASALIAELSRPDEEAEARPASKKSEPVAVEEAVAEPVDHKLAYMFLSKVFMVKVRGIKKYASEKSTYVLLAEDLPPISLGAASTLLNPRAIKEIMYDAASVIMRGYKAPEWDEVLSFVSSVLEVEYNEDTTDKGETLNWVRSYLLHKVADDIEGEQADWKSLVKESAPFLYSGEKDNEIWAGHYYFNMFGGFLEFVKDSFTKISPKELGTRLKMAGLTDLALQWREGPKVFKKQYWRISERIVRGQDG